MVAVTSFVNENILIMKNRHMMWWLAALTGLITYVSYFNATLSVGGDCAPYRLTTKKAADLSEPPQPKKKKKRRESYENREEVDYDEPKAVDRVLSTQTSTQSVRIGDLFP